MRQIGKLTQWKDEEGSGFITPDGGGVSVFAHIRAFSGRKRPALNDIVSYEVVSDEKDQPRADCVEFVVDAAPAEDSSLRGPGILAFAVFFLLLVADLVWLGRLPFAILGLYVVTSVVVFVSYYSGKSRTSNDQWWLPENTLHLWSLIGGWPGAALAQKLLHHKSKKKTFQVAYWFTIVLNTLAFIWLLTPPGSARLRSLLDGLGLG